MAREESNREDLLAEATALVQRVEFKLADGTTVVAGFRSGGEFSVFFGEDPAYHFNRSNELRRAYCDGLLVKASGRQLFSLERVRTQNETQLIRRAFSDEKQETFVAEMTCRLQTLQAALVAGTFNADRQVPSDEDVTSRVQIWLAASAPWQIAGRPNI